MIDPEKEQRIQTICLFVLATIAVCVAMFFLSPVLIPFVLAIFFTYCLTPIIEVQSKVLKFPRRLAILTTALLGCIILILIGSLITSTVSQIAANAEDYQQSSKDLVNKIVEMAPLERLGIEKEYINQQLLNNSEGAIRNLVSGTVSGFMAIVSKGLLVIIFVIFMLMGKKKKPDNPNSILIEVEARIKRYIITMVLISGVTGILVGTTLSLLQVQYYFLFGFFAFLLNFIPNIGSIAATLLPLPVILIDPKMAPLAKMLAIAVPGGIQFVIGNLIAPKIMGDSLELHPVAVLIALIFFGMLWGIVGMFLATPITAVAKICFQRMEFTQPLARLLSGDFDA